MTTTDFASTGHNAIASLVSYYGKMLEMLAAENAALRQKIAMLEAANREKAQASKPAEQ